jgi:hypothetical protein
LCYYFCVIKASGGAKKFIELGQNFNFEQKILVLNKKSQFCPKLTPKNTNNFGRACAFARACWAVEPPLIRAFYVE